MTPAGEASQNPTLPQAGSCLRWLRRPILPFVLLGLIGSLLVYHATAWGPWAFSDAAGYITAARNLVAGHGIGSFKPNGEFSPTVSHPPLYVLTLGAVSQVGFEPLEAARVVDVLLFGLLVFASGFMLSRLLRKPWPGLAFSAILLLHPALIIAYTSAMAEPPFIFLGLLSLLFLVEYLLDHKDGAFLGASLCAGGALLSRYPGAAYVLTGVLAVLLWGGVSPAVRLRRMAAFGALGGLPVMVFVLWSTSIPGAEGPRALAERPEILPGLTRFGRSVAGAVWNWKPVPPAVLLPEPMRRWDLPGSLVGVLALGCLIGVLWLGIRTFRRTRESALIHHNARPVERLLAVLGIFVGIYLGFFAAAYLFTNPTPDVDSRTLLPLLPALLGMLVSFAWLSALVLEDRRSVRAGWSALLLVALSGYAVISQDTVFGLHRTGLGYTGREWRQSETIAAIRRLPADKSLISNEPAAVLLLTGRSTYQIEEISQSTPALPFSVFGTGPTESERVFRNQHAALVLFHSVETQLEGIYGDRAVERLRILTAGLYPSAALADGDIFFLLPREADPEAMRPTQTLGHSRQGDPLGPGCCFWRTHSKHQNRVAYRVDRTTALA